MLRRAPSKSAVRLSLKSKSRAFALDRKCVFEIKVLTMSYKHKSGAQKRKEKEEWEKNLKDASKKQLSLSRFLKLSTSQDAASLELFSTSEPSTSHKDKIQSVCVDADTDNHTLPSNLTLMSSASPITETCFDVGSPTFNIDIDIKKSHEKLPENFPEDNTGSVLPISIFKKKLANGEFVPRDWLVWSRTKEALYCLPCRIFSKLPQSQRSALTSSEGYSTTQKWKKLHDKVPEHERSASHKNCYIAWKTEQRKLKMDTSLSDLLFKSIQHEQEVWKEILKRLFHITLFLCERGLAFRGDSNRIGDLSNGNFLGLLELLAIYDPILNDHLRKVRHSQETGTRLQVHYLSADIQNEFIYICAVEVINYILREREKAKYFAIIVDATPDSAHIEQTVFLIRYVNLINEAGGIYKVEERFLTFADCSKKTGEAITQLIVSKLEQFKIPLADCRGQGYDNGSNMKGTYKGVQARILALNNLAIYSACACHSINLCGVHAAESCSAALTFFGVVQKLYNLFSSSPQRWEILQKKIGHSLHSTSKTRWSARIESVKPFAAHLPGIAEALNELSCLNLSAESQSDVNGLKNYVRTFKCIVMASIWVKILKPIDIVNKVIQARGATVDVACKNLSSLIAELQALRNEGWENILNEAVIVAKNIGWPESFQEETKRGRKRRRMADEEEDEDDGAGQVTADVSDVTFKREVFYVILDQVIEDLTERFKSMQELCESFSVLWEIRFMLNDEIEKRATNLVGKYSTDLQYELVDEAKDLKTVYVANFGEEALQPLELLNALQKTNLACLFPNLCIALRIFLTIPATVASAERSFSTLKRVKSVLRSTMSQDRLSSLGVLAVEAELARQVNMEGLINDFASKKARKCNI